MNNGNDKSSKRTAKTFIFILISIIILLLLIKSCVKTRLVNEGIKIIDIKQSVDSFNDDEIYVKNLKKKKYHYDVTIHNYLEEDYYLYKIEIDNQNVFYDDLLKLLKHGKDTKFRLNVTSLKNIKGKVKIKFYYGKLKEIYVGDDVISSFGNEKIKLPEGKDKDGYKFLGYTDKEGSVIVKYKANKEYDLKDGTKLYPVYTEENPNTSTNDPNNDNNQNNNNSNTDNTNQNQEPEVKNKYIVTFDYQNGNPSTTKEVTYKEKYGDLPTASKTGYYFSGWYLDNQKITSDSVVLIASNVTLKAKYTIINYSINYNLDGGSASNASSYNILSDDIILNYPTKDGYEFIGWTGSNGDVPEKDITISKGSTGNKTYKANYSTNESVNYKVIHKQEQLDNTYLTVKEETFTAPYGTVVKPAVKTYEGFNSPEKQEITVKQDGTSTVTYKYSRKKYTFTLNNSEDVTSSHQSGEYPYETEITLTAKDKTGYDFSSWSNGELTNTISITLTDNITINPIYTPKTYEVVFNKTTGTGEMANQSFTYDEQKSLTKNTFTKLGHKFIGWNTKEDGTGDTYEDQAVVKNLVTEGTITLYAQYLPETYIISFNTYGGQELFSVERTYGSTYGELPDAIKTGYTFTGWYYNDQKIESNTVVDITSNITLQARYNVINYPITYDLNGGSATNPNYYTVEDRIVLNNPTKTGYTFAGWTGSNGDSYQTEVTIPKGSTGAKNYVAHFSANQNTKYVVTHKKQKLSLDGYETAEQDTLYGASDTKVTPETKDYEGFVSPSLKEITIKADGTTELEYLYNREMYTYTVMDTDNMTSSKVSGEYPYETEITITASSKEGYTFDGWSNGLEDNPATFKLDEDTNISPIYKANIYYVVFNNNTGTGSMENQEMTYDTDETLNKCTFTKAGYTFLGWTLSPNEGNVIEDEGTVKNLATSGNVILYAKWQARTDVTYKIITKKQNIDLTTYTETTNIYTGTTDTEVTPEVVNYTGYVSPRAQTITITGDGNASVTYTYNREMYEFNLPDTENVTTSHQPGEYPYGTEITITANEIPGYTFDGWSDGEVDNPRLITLDDDITVEPTYIPNTNTAYTVNHYKQKLSLDGYDLAETENLTGTTDSKVTPNVKTYTGFTAPNAVEVTIKGDGTTVVNYNYDREMYAYTVENTDTTTSSLPSGEYPYGTEITVTANEIPGYTFDGWNDGNTDNPRTITLTSNISIEPTYKANTNTSYTVNHYKQNINLDGYDLAETENLTGTTDSKVTPNVKTYTGFDAPVPTEVTIKGDGTTVVNYNYTRKSYTFTLNDSEDVTSSHQSGSYPYETVITLTANDKEGYTFSGWSNGDTNKTTTITLTENKEITPIYSNNTDTAYTVIHKQMNVNGEGYTTKETEILHGTTGSKVTPDVKTYTGFTSPEPEEITIKADGSSTLTYNYTRNKYDFVIEDRSNIDEENSTKNGKYYYQTEITVTAKEKTGYTFTGWSNGDSTLTTTFNLDDDITLEPIYTANKYNVVFNSNTGSGSMSDQEMTYNKEENLNKNTFTKTGYTFAGWNTKSDGEGTPYEDEASVKNLAASGNVILYAQWVANQDTPYKVIHKKQNLDLETYTEIEENYTATTDQEITPTVNTYTGYVTPSTQTTTVKGDGTTVVTYVYLREMYDFNLTDTENVTSSHQNGEYPYGTVITLTASNIQGYTFTGWSNGETSNPLTITLDDDIEISPVYEATTDVTYKVIHRKQNLTLDGYDVEEEITETGSAGDTITPAVKTYTGFTSPQQQTTTIKGDGTTVVTYDYDRISYTLTYDNTNDIDTTLSTPEGSYPYEYEITLQAKTKAGYTFDEWSNGETDNPLVFNLTDNVTIKPLYVANSDTMYKVIYRKQNVDLETYTDEVEERFGTTDSSITPAVINYTGFVSPQSQTTTINGDGTTEVIYVYTREMYTLTLQDTEFINEGDISGSYPYGTELTLTAKDRENYVFDRWSNNSTVNPTILTITGNQTVKPIYSSNSYNVTFNANGGTGSMNDQSITKNVKTSLITNEFTKSGSIFDSWNTEIDGSGTKYYDGEEVLNITDGDSITLYAIWAPSDKVARIGNTYYTSLANAITAVPTTGVETEVVLLKDTAEKAEIPTTKNVVIDLQNHTLSNNGNLNVVVNNGTLKLLNGTITTNVAQGAINNNSTGTMVVDGTNIIVSKSTSKQALYNDGGTLTLNNVYFSSESTIRATLHNLNNGSINLNSGTIISTSIYAIYNEKGTLNIGVKDENIKDSPVIQGKTYGIIANSTYKFYDGIIKGSTYHAGKTSNTGNTPSISNDVDETKISEIETDSTKVLGTEDIGGVTYKTLKLELSTPTPTNKTVTFNPNGGTISEKTREVPSGSKVGNLPTPSKNNNHFDGWFNESTGGTEVTKDTVINNDVTFYAHWTPTIDNALINPIRIAMKVGQERQIEITGPEGMETVTYTSNDTDVVTVDSTGKVTGISDGITTITITGTVSGITKTIDVEVIPARRFKVTFNPNGGVISETTRYVGEGSAIGELPTGTKGDLVVEGWYLDITTGIKITSDYIVNNDIVLTPKWREPIAEFTSGEEFIVKIKGLAGTELSVGEPQSYIQYYGGDKYTINEAITPVDDIVSIQKSNVQPDISTMDSNNIVSSENSNIPIYAWFDNGIIYWWTEASTAYLNQDSSYMFSGLPKVQSIDIENMSSVNVTDMSFMFANLQEINTIDLSYLDTRNVTNMNFMFGGSTFTELDLTKLNTSKVTTMVAMFQGTKVPSLDFRESDLRKVKNTTDMFGGSDIQEVNFDNVQTDSLTKMTGMFVGSKFVNLDLSDFDTSNVTNMYDIFSSTTTLKTLNMNNWDFSGLTSLKDFYNNGLSGLEEIKLNNVNTTTITDMSFMFGNCTNLKKIELDGFDTNNVTNMYYMFGNCTSLTELDLSDFNTSNVTTMEAMFYRCSSLTELDLSTFNTSNVTNIGAIFNTCSSLTELDLSNWDLSNINQGALMMNASGGFSSLKTLIMDNAILPSNMYYGFGGLSGVEEISLNNVDTSNVTNMSVMFNSCSSLTELDLSSFDTSEVTNMDSMFNGCSSLTSLDLSMFNTSNVSSMGSMFYYCSSLIELNLSNWSFVKYPADSIHGSMSIPNSLNTLIMDNVYFGTSCSDSFGSMSSLESISLNNVDTSDVTNMSHMFGSASSIKNLDLRSFDTSKVTNMSYMFDGMTGLESITVSDLFVVSQVTDSALMFAGDVNLVGGAGTVYTADHIDKEYAHYDMGENFPGYFNSKSMSGEYVISFKDGDKLVDYKYINQGDSIGELPVYVKIGYTLDYWMVDNVQIDNTYTPTQNTTVYAKMTANKYTISFESNGGSEVSSYNRDYGTEVGPLPTPTKSGNTFIGWYKNSNLTSKVTSDTIVTGDMKLYAKWNPYYTVTLNANGGKFDDDETTRQVVYQNTTTEKYSHTSNISDTGIRSGSYQNNLATKDVVTFENAKKLHVKITYGTQTNNDYVYVFKGIYDGEVSAAMSKGQLKTYTGGNNNTTTVEFDVDGDTTTFAFYSNASTAYYGYYAVVTPCYAISDTSYEEPTRSGYKFAGWNTSQDGSGTTYLDERELISTLSNKTVFAQWIEAKAMFDTGANVNKKLKKLAGNSTTRIDTLDENITSIQKSNIKPDLSQMTSDNTVSISNQIYDTPIYMWYDNGTIYWWSEDNNPSLNANSINLFSGLTSMYLIDLNSLDTSSVTTMERMFSGCESLTTLDLSGFDTTNVTDMSHMFNNCNNLSSIKFGNDFDTSSVTLMEGMFNLCKGLTTLDLSSFDTTNVTYMNEMFRDCLSLTSLDLGDNFDTGNVINMEFMFMSCKTLTTLDLGNKFDTSKVMYMKFMFWGCENLTTLDLSTFNTISAVGMGRMFTNCSSLTTLHLGNNFNTSSVTNMDYMFAYCYNLTTIYATISFDTTSVTSSNSMFTSDTKLVGGLGTLFNSSKINKEYAHLDGGPSNPGYFTDKNPVSITFDSNGGSGVMTNQTLSIGISTSIKLNEFTKTGCTFKEWNTSRDGSGTTYSDGASITVSGSITLYAQWDEAKAMFDTGLNVNVKMKKIAGNSSPSYNTRDTNITSIQKSNIKPDTSLFTSDNIVSIENATYNTPIYMWFDNGKLYWWSEDDIPSFNEESSNMFRDLRGVTSIDLSDIDASQVTTMQYMFLDCINLTDLDLGDYFNTSKVRYMSYMFGGCSSLTSLDLGDNFDTSNATTMMGLFEYCSSLTSLDLGDKFDTSSVKNMTDMFWNCSSLTSIDLGDKFNTSNVEYMEEMFYECSSLTSLNLGDNFDTSKVQTMQLMFDSCNSLISLDLGDKFNTSAVQEMYSMFNGCSSLIILDLGDKFDTSNVDRMDDMFNGCSSLTVLDLGDKFITSRTTDMSRMFKDCSNLITIYVNTSFDTSNIYSSSDMFTGDTNLVGGWGTKYDSSHKDKTYARIDEYNGNPGYFTAKQGWYLQNRSTIGTPADHLLEQEWSYYEDGERIESGFHWLEDLYGQTQKYYFINGVCHLGWLEYDGDYYYLSTEDDDNNGYVNAGAYRSVTKNIDGVDYEFDSEGRCIEYSGQAFYTIELDPNGGTVSPIYKNINQGSALGTLPVPTRTGYEFLGWWTDIQGGIQVTSETVPNSSVKYIAKWDYKKVVTFNANGGIFDNDEETNLTKYLNGSYCDNTSYEEPTRQGYVFAGWNTKANGTGQSYLSESSIINDIVSLHEKRLYAQWQTDKSIILNATSGSFENEEKIKTINYIYGNRSRTRYSHTANVNDNGKPSGGYGNNLSSNDIVTIPGATSLNIEVWYTTEHINSDWLAIYPEGITPTSSNYSEATISGGKLAGHGNYPDYTKPSDSDETYHNVFKVDGDTVQFYFKSNGSNGFYGYYAIITSEERGYLPSQIINNPTKSHYSLIGWNTKEDGTGDPYLIDELGVAADTLPTNTTLYAQWLVNTQVTFDSNGGSFENGESTNKIEYALNKYQEGTYYEVPDRFGYSFAGWNTKEDGTGTNYVSESSIIFSINALNDKTVYAQWIENTATFTQGEYFNEIIKRLAGHSNPSTSTSDRNIISIQRQYNKPDYSKITCANVADIYSPTKIYAWYDNGVIYWYSESKTVEMHANSHEMFMHLEKLESIDFSTIRTNNVSHMYGLFWDCESITSLDLSTFNTSNVTEMTYMFSNCESLTSINFGNNFITSNVTNMGYMFDECSSLVSLDLIHFDTSNVEYMYGMFRACSSLIELDVSSFNTSKVTNMSGMFMYNPSITSLDISNFDTSSVTNMSSMFLEDTRLTTIYVSSKFVTASVTSSSSMFSRCTSIVGGCGTTYDSSKINYEYAKIDEYNGNPGYFTAKTAIGIDFDANGGTGTMSMQVIDSTVSNTLNANTFTRNNYTFAGWNTASDGSGTSYSDGATISAGTINKYTKLYAQWSENQISIIYEANGGTGTMSNQPYGINSSVTLNANSFTRSGDDYGYEFVEWNTASDGSGTSYSDGATIPANTYSADVRLYAQWRLHGWQLVNSASVQPPQDHLLDQQWSYYEHGVIKADGLQTLPDLYGINQIYYIKNGFAQIDWQEIDGNWYYFDIHDPDDNHYTNCNAYKDGWYEIDGVNYQFDADGICLNPNAGSNVGSSLSRFLYKYDLEHKALSIVAVITLSVLGVLFSIYMIIKRKKRVNN